MEYELYIIYDSATGHYTIPMAHDNDATAIRALVNEALKEGSIWNSHPQDFTLYKCGIFNVNDGTIMSFQSPERVGCITDFMRKE